MAVNLSPIGGVAGQFFDNNGNPLVGGKLFTYAAGTTTPQVTFTSALGNVPNSNPIILNGGGRVPAEIWLTDGLEYKFVLLSSTDQLIGAWDNITGINSNFVNFVTSEEVQTATAGQTVFTLTTMSYQPGTNNLVVYVDGVNQIEGSIYSFVETSSTVVTFTTGLHVGALVKFVSAETLTGGATSADLVSYLPAGVGAVATNVQTKLRETVSVKDFGAVGDGVTDDTAAIQAGIDAINAAGGGALYFPAGIYRISANLWARNKVSMVGDKGATEIRLDQGVNTQILANQNATVPITVDDFSIINLIFNANANGTEAFTASAVAVNGVKRFVAKSCVFKNATGYGLAFQSRSSSPTLNGVQEDIWIEDCEIYNNGFNGTASAFDGFDVKASNRMYIKNCIAYGNAITGFNIRGQSVTADGLIAYDNGQYGVSDLGGGVSTELSTHNLSNVHTYDNGIDGLSVATSEAISTGRFRINIVNLNSHENGRSGIRFFENLAFPVFSEFEIAVSNANCWGNTSHGLENNMPNIKSLVVSSSIFRVNGSAGIRNDGNNCVFSGCYCFENGNYGYEGTSGRTGNQFIGGAILNNLNTIRFTNTVNTIGVQGATGLFVEELPSAVNFLKIQGRGTNGAPRLSVDGPDTNVGLSVSTKGASLVQFFRNNFVDEMLRVNGVNGATGFFQLVASTANRPQLQAIGSGTDIDVEFVPKGIGKVRFGAHTGTSDTAISGYIEIKDSLGIIRKLAVIS